MQHTLKSIVLGHLLIAGICTSGYAELDHETLFKAEEYFLSKDLPDGSDAIKKIDRYTKAAIAIAENTEQRIKNSRITGSRKQFQERAGVIARQADDIRNRVEGILREMLQDAIDNPSLGELSLTELGIEADAAEKNFNEALALHHRVLQAIDRIPSRCACCK
jgi:hypothetical protein